MSSHVSIRSYENLSYNIVSRTQSVEGTMLYSELRILANRNTLSAKSRDIWAATLSGLVVGGLLATVLSMVVDPPISTAVGALVGGVVAAYVLYGKISQAAAAGALAGTLSTPFFLGVSEILIIFEVIPLPPGSPPPLWQLREAVVIIVLTNLVAGAIGGAAAAIARHPPLAQGLPPAPQTPGAAPAQPRYCVQCGALLPAGASICPHCNARQPQ